MFGILISLLSGALMSIQGVFNTQVNKATMLVCFAGWLWKERIPFSKLWTVEPKYMLLGGVIGAFITFTVIKGMEMLGPARSVMLIVVSQLLVAYVIELFGMFGVEKQPFEWRKVIGMAITIGGIILFKVGFSVTSVECGNGKENMLKTGKKENQKRAGYVKYVAVILWLIMISLGLSGCRPKNREPQWMEEQTAPQAETVGQSPEPDGHFPEARQWLYRGIAGQGKDQRKD